MRGVICKTTLCRITDIDCPVQLLGRAGNRGPLHSQQLPHASSQSDYSFFLPAAFAFAQRAFAIAEILALAAALIVRFFFAGLPALPVGFAALILAQRAF